MEQRAFVLAVVDIVAVMFVGIAIVVVAVENSMQLFFGLPTARTVMGSTSRLNPLTAGRASNSHDDCRSCIFERQSFGQWFLEFEDSDVKRNRRRTGPLYRQFSIALPVNPINCSIAHM